MNIVYATDQYWPSISGVSVSIDSFKNEFEAMGHNVCLFVPDYPEAREFDKIRGKNHIFRFRSYKLFFNDENQLIYRNEKKNIFKALDSVKPDIIHVHTEFTMGKIATQYARKNNIPLVITAHTNWEELISLYIPFIPTTLARIYCRHRMRKRYNKANMVVVPTSLMELLLYLYFVKPPIRVIPTGININELVPPAEESQQKKQLPDCCSGLDGHQILLFVGRIGKEKNIPFLFEVLKKIVPVHPLVKLIICGDGPYKKDLEKLALLMNLKDHLIFTGFVKRTDLRNLYLQADILVFASKVESQGLVPLEAMTFGLPVVAIGKMGTREVMGGDYGGFMVEDDLDLFVEKVSLLLHQPELREKKSREAKYHAQKWTMKIQAAKMDRLYQSLCKSFIRTG